MKTRRISAAGFSSLLLLAWLLAACGSTPQPPITMTPVMSPGPAACVDFEDLASGTMITVPNSFTTAGYSIQTRDFVWGNGTATPSGFAEVSAGGSAGGSGNELQVNNINLVFKFDTPMNSLKLLFGEYGGNLNIEINGDFVNFEDFAAINGATIGGVGVSVPSGGLGNDMGTLELSGSIETFLIGGQELFIDDVCPQG